jgi:glycogen debranching enzyme
MGSANPNAHKAGLRGEQVSRKELEERKERVLAHGSSSITASIADAVVIKRGNVYFLTKPGGNVPSEGDHGFGLYYNDCRYLNSYELKIFDAEPNALVSNDSRGYRAVFELTNPEIMVEEGKHIRRDEIGITWRRVVSDDKPALHDILTFRNYEQEEVHFRISLAFGAQFESVFAIRGLLPLWPGKLAEPVWEGQSVRFAYAGADGLHRSLDILFSCPPSEHNEYIADFDFKLEPNQAEDLMISLFITETPDPQQAAKQEAYDMKTVQAIYDTQPDYWIDHGVELETNSLLMNRIVDRALLDLDMLRTEIDGNKFIAAGVPWYVTLFGRDTLIVALQTLTFFPSLAEETLRLLAEYQGRELREWNDEAPGKILHELRAGELARIGEIPHTPYYGTADATPLFLILVARHAAWTGDLSLFYELENNIERALLWIDEYGDLDGDGYVEYQRTSGRGLVNKGWKDSSDSIVNADGTLVDQPVALVEVQAYVYMGKVLIADLYERAGNTAKAGELREQAAALQERFNRDFWDENLGFYVLALQKDNRQARVVSSNPGHALWAGIATAEQAQKTVLRMMEKDMFNGWGIRTLSTSEKRYNPIGYHLGTVWPHDNGLIAAGFRRYGHDEPTRKIFMGMAEAALHFPDDRLPELFAGFPMDQYQVPVSVPLACHPQGWAAGSILFFFETLLGLAPDAFAQRLTIYRPMLPDYVDVVSLRGLKVGQAEVDLTFHKEADGKVNVEVTSLRGRLTVDINNGS